MRRNDILTTYWNGNVLQNLMVEGIVFLFYKIPFSGNAFLKNVSRIRKNTFCLDGDDKKSIFAFERNKK